MRTSRPPKKVNFKFISWTFLYAALIWVATGKARWGDGFPDFVWGLVLGLGAALAVSGIVVQSFFKRLLLVIAWAGFSVFSATIIRPLEERQGTPVSDMVLASAIFGFPALLGLLVWLVRKPRVTT
jgi:hypothetical protein